jgi:DNA-binding beta-propeller fold protein YncE
LVAKYRVGRDPFGVTFDGVNIWVANESGSVTKLRACDGCLVWTYAVWGYPSGVTFDGANIWAANAGGTVTKLRADDGSLVGTYESQHQ